MISFLHPWALLGLAAAAIPIVLHLFHRRRPPTVVFPAIQYLVDATRQHQRRLKLRNLLLLLIRTAIIVALVLAAAAPAVPLSGIPGHVPTALAVILDNSASSGAVVDGVPRLIALKEAARAALARATPDDAVWLLLADGAARRGTPASLRTIVDEATPSPRRLDLGAAITEADDVLTSESLPREILLISDLQASALSQASPAAALVVARPTSPPPPNAGIARVELGTQPWLPQGGRVAVATEGDTGRAVLTAIRAGDQPARQTLMTVGVPGELRLTGLKAGWWPIEVSLDADEMRIDDVALTAVRVAPPARVEWDPLDRYLAAAAEVLVSAGRADSGKDLTLGRLGGGRGTSVVVPPADPAGLGALNRALARRGVAWRYGQLIETPTLIDSAGEGTLHTRPAVHRRYALEPLQSGRTGTLLTAGGQPWMVRSEDVVLLGSRLEREWTDLVLSAEFVPFIDVLLNQVAHGDVPQLEVSAGDRARLPDVVTEVRSAERVWAVEGGAAFRPLEPGLLFLLAAGDTVGTLAVTIDSRESRLLPASDAQTRRLWSPARVIDLDQAGAVVFAAGARSDLRGPILWLALLLGLAELGVASAGGGRGGGGGGGGGGGRRAEGRNQ